MEWTGKFIGAMVGFWTTRSIWGALIGALIGHLFDRRADFGFTGPGAGGGPNDAARAYAAGQAYVSEVFFRTTFELMGHVAKSDGHVSEAEIDAARRLMQELKLGPNEIHAAIECFTVGKAPQYDADSSVERLRAACGQRHDLLHTFVELQLRAALAGDGILPRARAILLRAAGRLGISGPEFVQMESALRARHPSRGKPLAESYAELEVSASMTDQEVIKAYRRQMSRHHPDKMVANGLPESMAQMAKEKTQRIQEAYEAIRAARGMR